jgi:hypothetical protein
MIETLTFATRTKKGVARRERGRRESEEARAKIRR